MRQDEMTVSTYYTKLRGIWDEIQSTTPVPKCTCGGCKCELGKQITLMREKERLYEFLMGLNDEYSVVKTQILSTKPTPTLGNAYHLVAEDERQRQISTSRQVVSDAAAFQVQGRRETTDRRNEKKEGKRFCTHCHKNNHTVETCYKLIGYPPKKEKEGGWKTYQPRVAAVNTEHSPIPGLSRDQFARLVQLLETTGEGSKSERVTNSPIANMSGKVYTTNSWVIDSGATEHITCNENYLYNLVENGLSLPVKIPNGESIPVKNIGNARLPNGLDIKCVLNVPNFKCNLLSVSRLTRDLNCSLTFFPEFCVIQDLHSRNPIGLGKARNGLYFLEPVGRGGVAFSVSLDSKTWHRRLGHISAAVLQRICRLKNSGSHDFFCDSCIRAKQTRLSFPVSSIKTNDCFELIHCDIWGRYKVASFSGAHYFFINCR